MLLREFPNLTWLKEQIKSRFEDKKRWDGQPLPDRGWPSVVLNVKSGPVYRDNISGPFSLFGNIKGHTRVTVDKRTVNVDDDHFFITNSRQEYTLEIGKSHPTETFNIHFGDSFVESLVQSLNLNCDQLLDPSEKNASFSFHNRLIPKTPKIKATILSLRDNNENLREEELLASLFIMLFQDRLDLDSRAESISSVKASTRSQIMKQLLLGVDFAHENYRQSVGLEEMAKAGCLSKFHFLRLFKMAFSTTPHQFITALRIEKAKAILRETKWEISEVSRAVGFPDSSSFSRSFHKHTGVYPTHFRTI